MQQQWKLMKNVVVSIDPVMPGVWKRKEGGHVVRGRATPHAMAEKTKDIFKVLPEATAVEAKEWLEQEQRRVRDGDVSAKSRRMRFSEFVEELLEHKVAVREIRSAKGRERWGYTLEHLIAGTEGEKAKKHVPGFGDFYVDAIRTTHVEDWKRGICELIAAGDYAPTTANGWLSILRVIMKAARKQFELPRLVTEDVGDFDTSEHVTYTEEEPNSLEPGEVPGFLATTLDLYPQHYAMTYLGLITGLRPSTLRPLRRRGPKADVLWDKQRILVRRSQTLGDEVMETTKQRKRYPIDLPKEAMDVLKWHVETQLVSDEMKESDLLFPSITGKYRAPSVLNKPFADVADTIGLGKHFTQKGLRRTFQDLARAAGVEGIITRSICGHTPDMTELYSSISGREQRASIGRVISLFARDPHPTQVATGEQRGEQPLGGGEQSKKAS